MAKGTVKRRPTPSAKRQKKLRQRVRKQVLRKRQRSKPNWESAVAKAYDASKRGTPHTRGKRPREEGASEGSAASSKEKKKKIAPSSSSKRRKTEEGLSFVKPEEEREVESDVDEEKEERMNERNPMETQLFLKGVPLDATEEELLSFLQTHFGKVKRVLLVKSKITQRLSGTGFVHCGTAGLADAIFTHAQKNAREVAAGSREDLKEKTAGMSHHQAKRLQHKLWADTTVAQDPFLYFRESKITVHRPLKRSEAQETLSAAEKKKKKRTKVAADDPRHLYLLQEGLITEDSPAAKDLPIQYLRAIWKAYEARKAQLQNTNYFVSKNRLSVRNLPRHLTENDVRRIFAKYARRYLDKHPEDLDKEKWGKYGPIKNVKLVLDPDGQAKGYGFIEFANHNVALACLRYINNNPTLFGDRRRLIVSFAVENIMALQKLKQRKELKLQRAAAAKDGEAMK